MSVAPAPPRVPVLCFEQVTRVDRDAPGAGAPGPGAARWGVAGSSGSGLGGAAASGVPLLDVSLELHAGELMLIALDEPTRRTPLADLALGLAEPDRGRVLFEGQAWGERGARRAWADRGRIGWVPPPPALSMGWPERAGLDEAITLAQRHHSGRPAGDIAREAAGLCLYFGMPGLPLTSPRWTLESDLGRSACARAFLGAPALLLLECPEASAGPSVVAPLANLLGPLRHRGAAVLWTTASPGVFDEPALRPTRRARLVGARLRDEPAPDTGSTRPTTPQGPAGRRREESGPGAGPAEAPA